MKRDGHSCPSWGEGSDLAHAERILGVAREEFLPRELPFEKQVSDVLRPMSILWLGIDNAPGPDSERAYIERSKGLICGLSPKGSAGPANPSTLHQ